MTKEALTDQLLLTVSRLAPTRRRQLDRILSDPKQARAFQRFLESALALYNGSGKSQDGDDDDAPRNVASGAQDEESLRQSFFTVLWDKDAFPRTTDVIKAVEYFFDKALDPRRFTKAGRLAAIEEAWRQIRAMPRPERSHRLARFFDRFSELLDPHRSYRELFKVLSRSE